MVLSSVDVLAKIERDLRLELQMLNDEFLPLTIGLLLPLCLLPEVLRSWCRRFLDALTGADAVVCLRKLAA